MRVTLFQRRPFSHNFSIERVFAAVLQALPFWVDCRVAVSRFNGANPLKVLYNLAEAFFRRGGIHHVTGDISYLAWLLPKERTLLTVHDCVGMVQLQGWRRRMYHWLWLKIPVRRSALVTVVSESTRREVMAYTGCPEEKIRVVPDPLGEEFRPAPREFRADLPVILQVGAGANKNVGRLAAALRGIACELHVVGHLREDDRRHLDQAAIRYRVSRNLTGGEMLRAYEECDLVAFASTYEGFGMPIMEAQAVGRPVVTSNLEPMVSVAGGAACLVDPESPEAIRAGILRVIQDPAYRQELVERGWQNARRFSARTVAAAYAEVYRELAGEKAPAREARPTILILLGAYLPGYRAGGPIRSIANLVETFGDDFNFRIITSDRDHQGRSPYRDVPAYEWVPMGKAEVLYLPPTMGSLPSIIGVIRRMDPQVLYINSLFSPLYSIVPMLLRWLGLVHPRMVLLAPRGELSAGALRLKAWKKYPFRKVAGLIGLHRSILWHASTQYEAQDILAEFFGSDVAIAEPLPVRTACDLPDRPHAGPELAARGRKAPGCLRIAFLSRISPKKNLVGALEMLHGLEGDVSFTIYGPVEDTAYWEECRAAIGRLPDNVRAEYRGELPHNRVAESLARHDLFFLPTHGENYGHVIAEALAAGCPVLISDQTAWRNLAERGVGWDLPLDAPERFREAIQTSIAMGPEEFREFSLRAHQYAVQHGSDSEILRSNRDLLNFAVRYPALGGLREETHSL